MFAGLLFFLLLFSPSADAVDSGSKQYGIHWEYPENIFEAEDQLTRFQRIGISTIIVDGILPYDIMDVLSRYDFEVIVQLPYYFITGEDLGDRYQHISRDITDYSIYYSSFDDVKSLSLFFVGDQSEDLFNAYLQNILDRVNVQQNLTFIQPHWDFAPEQTLSEIYDTTPILLFDYEISISKQFPASSSTIYLYADHPYRYNEFSSVIAARDSCLIIIESSYFFSGIDPPSGPAIDSVITATIRDANTIFDRPVSSSTSDYPDLLVLIMVITLLGFGVHYGFEPNYRKSISRYFGAHSFFVVDIVEKRIRFGTSLILIMLVQSILFGVMKTFVLNYTLSPLQFDALHTHLPWITFASSTMLGSIALNALVFLVFILFCTSWLNLTFKGIHQFYQAVTLYLWPLHLAIPVSLIYMITIITDYSDLVSGILLTIYAALILLCFILASSDLIRTDRSTSLTRALSWSIIPYSLLFLFLLFYLFPALNMYDLINLIQNLG